MQKNNLPLISDYRNYPLEVCSNFINNSDLDFEKINKKYKSGLSDENQLFHCSPLFCSKYERDGLFIRFKSKVNFNITSFSYEVILFFVQQFFNSSSIKFGFAEFGVTSLEISEGINAAANQNYKVIAPIPYNISEIISLLQSERTV